MCFFFKYFRSNKPDLESSLDYESNYWKSSYYKKKRLYGSVRYEDRLVYGSDLKLLDNPRNNNVFLTKEEEKKLGIHRDFAFMRKSDRVRIMSMSNVGENTIKNRRGKKKKKVPTLNTDTSELLMENCESIIDDDELAKK